MKLSSFIVCFLASIYCISQTNVNKIKGIVTSYDTPLANANISIKGASEGTRTDASGKYTIEAKPRDVLVFSYVGMNTLEIIVEDITSILNIDMTPRVEELDEVIVQQKKKKGQEGLALDYNKNKSIINTSFGFIDAEKTSFNMTSIDGSDLNSAAVDIVSALIGKVPGLERGQEVGTIFLRGGGGSLNNPKTPIFEVDGNIFVELPTFVPIETIDRIAVIPGLRGVSRYGNIAAGGVIIINTTNRSSGIGREKGSNKPYDQAKLRDNKFDERSVQGKFKREPPKYILEMKKASNVDDAISVFDTQKKLYGRSPYFYLKAADFFKESYATSGKDELVIEEMKSKYENNPNVLKALAYRYEVDGNLEAALKLYIEVFKKRPRYAQSYRDLANMYTKTSNYKKAAGLYVRYQKSRSLDTVTTIFEGVDAIIDSEFSNLLALHGKELVEGSENSRIKEYQGIRVLFEWNNSEAEFDLQFVNPENTYFIWSHTAENEPERITDEKIKGYSSEQFFIDESKPGKWMINLKYHGNKSYEPTILKTTIYYNYGLPTQRSQVKTYRLELKNVNQQLITLQNR